MSIQRKTDHSNAANAVIMLLLLLIFITKATLGAARPLALGDTKTTLGAKKVSFPEERGRVPPSVPKPCTYIPEPGNIGHCNK
jgi:hypothetical protein